MERNEQRGRPALGLQVTLILLLALLPIALLVGRRSAPAAIPTPLLMGGAATRLDLAVSHPGLGAGRPPEITRPVEPGAAVLIEFAPPGDGTPPYQLSLTGPDGGLTWQIVWPDLAAADGSSRLAVPASLLRPGRNSLVIRDGRGRVSSLPFLVR